MDMSQSMVNPCVFYRMEDKVVVIIHVCHVDDNVIAGTPECISWFKEGVKKYFGVWMPGQTFGSLVPMEAGQKQSTIWHRDHAKTCETNC
jgi:hypothetical protein